MKLFSTVSVTLTAALCSLSLGLACSLFEGSDTGGAGGGGDAGATGTTADGGGTGTTGTTAEGIDCDNPPDPSAVGGPDCVTDTIACGDTIVDTTEGGTSNWAGDAYQGWFCIISTASEYDGPERVYAFDHPGKGMMATITLTSPCDDLDLVAVRWQDENTCPLADYSVNECEGDQGAGDNVVSLWNPDASRYLVVVDALGGGSSPFSLSVSCE